MPAFRTTSHLIRAYAESNPSWEASHDEAMYCRDVEEILVWGVCLFRGLARIEADLQGRALAGKVDPSDPVWAEYDKAYRSLVAASEAFLRMGEDLSARGYDVEGLDDLRGAVEEGRCQIELWDLEPELPAIEEARPFLRPENPRPARYGT